MVSNWHLRSSRSSSTSCHDDVPPKLRRVRAYTRQQVLGTGVPDLVLVLEGERSVVSIIENKLCAEEGRDQTLRYATPECFAMLRDKLTLSESATPAYLYLTLFPAPAGLSPQFFHKTYRDLLPYLGMPRRRFSRRRVFS